MNTQVKKDLEDALHLINKAAREEKEELSKIIHEKYGDVKAMFTEKIAQGSDKAKQAITEIDKNLKENPWMFVATAAASAFLLGFFLDKGRNK